MPDPVRVQQAAVTSATLHADAALAASCAGCHLASSMPNGSGLDEQTQAAIKNLAGFSAEEISARMLAYKLNDQGQTVMHRIARGYTQAEIQRLAVAYRQTHPVIIQASQ